MRRARSATGEKTNSPSTSERTNGEDPKALTVARQPTESPAEALARTSLQPTIQAALTLMEYNKNFGELSINTLVDDLRKQCELASGGDLRRSEAILTAQAHTLDAIFHTLARRAQRVEYLNQLETNMRLALKAQSQCRATIETLAEIKNPKPVAFVQQANIANGPQQVNNGPRPLEKAPRARESENQPNKLLEEQRNEWMDGETARTAANGNTSVDALGAIHGAKDDRG